MLLLSRVRRRRRRRRRSARPSRHNALRTCVGPGERAGLSWRLRSPRRRCSRSCMRTTRRSTRPCRRHRPSANTRSSASSIPCAPAKPLDRLGRAANHPATNGDAATIDTRSVRCAVARRRPSGRPARGIANPSIIIAARGEASDGKTVRQSGWIGWFTSGVGCDACRLAARADAMHTELWRHRAWGDVAAGSFAHPTPPARSRSVAECPRGSSSASSSAPHSTAHMQHEQPEERSGQR
jgi:hypothetical protein